MYRVASRFLQSKARAAGVVRSNSEIMAEKELRRFVSERPEYEILINNLTGVGQSAVKTLRTVKKGAHPTQIRLSVSEPLRSRDYKEFCDNIAEAWNDLEAAARKLGTSAKRDDLSTKVNSIHADLGEVIEALGIAKV
jgi:hypothetical protein